jgi:hypothetical protein
MWYPDERFAGILFRCGQILIVNDYFMKNNRKIRRVERINSRCWYHKTMRSWMSQTLVFVAPVLKRCPVFSKK